MPRWERTQVLKGVATSAREINRITGATFRSVVQQLHDGMSVIIPAQVQAENKWPVWICVWKPGRWVYFTAFAAATVDDAITYTGQSYLAAKRDPSTLTEEKFFAAAQTALRRFRQDEQEFRNRGDYRPGYAPRTHQPEPRPAPLSIPVSSPSATPSPEKRIEDRIAKKRAAILQYGKIEDMKKPSLEEAEPTEKILLLAFMRNNPSEQLDIVIPLVEHPSPLSPSEEADIEIIDSLWRNGWLQIDESSSVNAFDWDDVTPTAHYPAHVVWRIMLPEGIPTAHDLLVKLEQQVLQKPLPSEWCNPIVAMWAWTAQLECVAYLELSLHDHALPFHAGEKTYTIIQKLLKHFSIGQIHNLIWRAARDAGARIRREAIAPQHAANTAIGAIERMGDRAQAEEWTLKPYRRDRRLKESSLSHLVFRARLGLEEPFETRIRADIIRNLVKPSTISEPPSTSTQ